MWKLLGTLLSVAVVLTASLVMLKLLVFAIVVATFGATGLAWLLWDAYRRQREAKKRRGEGWLPGDPFTPTGNHYKR